MGVVSSTTTVSITSGAPSWFTSQTEKTWVAVAGGTGYGAAWQNGSRQTDVKPSNWTSYGSDFRDLVRSWNGGDVIQSTREFLQWCEGGHNTWHGNDIYALQLGQEVPAWNRIYGPSASSLIVSGDPSENEAYDANLDGSPRTSHGWFNRKASGTRLYVFRTSDGPSSTPTSNCWSIDRNNLAAGWMYHGRTLASPPGSYGSGWANASGPSGYDPVTNKVYFALQFTNGAGDTLAIDEATLVAAGSVSTTGPQMQTFTSNKASGTGVFNDSWSAVVRITGQPPVWVCGSPQLSQLKIRRLDNLSLSVIDKTPTGTAPPSFGRGMGAAYHSPSQAIILGGWGAGVTSGATIYKLNIPNDVINGTYSWSSITNNGGVTPSTSDGNQGVFGRFRMIEDMGNGQAALVLHVAVNGPAFVYKMPSGAI